MDSDLNILPPDKDIFHEKKQVSNKQKEHLIKAREAAKATMERRRKAEEELKRKEEAKENVTVEESVEEEEVEETPKPKRKGKAKVEREETEHERDLRKFDQFMKNMKLYEEAKVAHQKQIEEANKIKFSLTKDEYNQMMYILDQAEKKTELAAMNPAKSEPQKREEAIKPRIIKMGNNSFVANTKNGRASSRFD